MDSEVSSSKVLPNPYCDAAASVHLPSLWLLLAPLHIISFQEGRMSLPECGTWEGFASSPCVCEHPYPVMALLDHRSSPQGKTSEFPGLTASENPSLAGISACVWVLCLCLAPSPIDAQETLAVGVSALLFGWGCVWAHIRLQSPYKQLMKRFYLS